MYNVLSLYYQKKGRFTIMRREEITKGETILYSAILVVFFLLYGLVGTLQTTYKINGTITRTECDKIIIEDDNGKTWSFYGDDGYMVGDRVIARVFNNDTQRISDDRIENVKVIKK